MIGTKTSRSRTRPTRIRTCRLGAHLQWDLEWLEHRVLLIATMAASAALTSPIGPVLPVGIFDSIVGPGDAFLTSNSVAIGGQVQYQVNLSIPQGTVPDANFSDLFFPGLALQSIDSISADPGLSTSVAGGFAGVLDGPGSSVGGGGSSFDLDFGTLTNINSGRADINLTFTAVVLNTQDNQTGTSLTNQASFSDSGGASSTFAAPVRVETPDLGITDTGSAPSGNAGGAPITFTVVVAHTSASANDAFNVVVNDLLPSGLTLVAGSLQAAAGATPSALLESDNGITATYDDFPLGSTSTVSFQATLDPADAPGAVEQNTASVTYTTLAGNVTTPQSPYNGLSTGRTGDPADPGGTFNNLNASATASVAVNGASLGGNVYVDANDDGVLESGEPGIGGVAVSLSGVDSLGNAVTAMTTTDATGAYLFTGLRAGTYAITATEPASYVAGVDAIGTQEGSNPAADEFTNIVLVSGSSGLGYDFAERPTAALALGETIDNGTPNVGAQVSYSVSIQNSGPDDANGVLVTVPLPAGLSFVSATPSDGFYDASTGNWTVPALADGGTATLTIIAAVNSPAAQTLTATVVASNQAILPSAATTASVTEVPQTAALALSTGFMPSTPNVGDIVAYQATLTNNGPDAASDVEFTAALPPGLTFISASTTAASQYDPASGMWSVGTLAPGATVSITISARIVSPDPQTIAATVTADQYDPAPAGASASATVTPQVADLDLTSALSSATPNVGDALTDTVTLTDNGPAAASGIVVSVPLPPGLTFQSAVPSQGTYISSTGVWTVGGLASGGSITLQLMATAASPAPQSFTAAITAADQYDPVAANNTVTLLETPQIADLDLTEAVSNPDPNLGDTIKFTTTLVNNGPAAATNVAAQSLLPAGLVLVSATPSQGTYDATTGRWAVGSVPAAGDATLVLSARVGSPTPATVTAAIAASDQYDPVPGNNSSKASEQIQVANLSLTEAVSDPTPVVGETVSYTVSVGNSGPDNATNVTTAVPLPAGLTFATAIPSQGTYDPATGIWTIGSLAVGVLPTLTLTAEVATASTETTTAAISSVDQFVPDTLDLSQSVTVTPQAAVVQVARIEVAQQFAPIIGTLITGSSGTTATVSGAITAASTSGSGAGSGSGADSGDSGSGPGSLARGQSRSSPSASGTRATPHAHAQPHASAHAAPHATGPEPPLIVIIPENALAIHAVAAPPGAVAVHNNPAGAGGFGVLGGLPAQPLAARSAAPAFSSGSSGAVQDLNAPFAATNNTGAVGTTMKVITFIQAQRIWSRGSRAHQHGARRRFR